MFFVDGVLLIESKFSFVFSDILCLFFVNVAVVVIVIVTVVVIVKVKRLSYPDGLAEVQALATLLNDYNTIGHN